LKEIIHEKKCEIKEKKQEIKEYKHQLKEIRANSPKNMKSSNI
jgi:hypothetical protein